MLHSVTRALTALALGAAVSLMPAAARGEVIDRILAVVNRELITLSDVAAAIRLGLVSVPQEGSDPTRAVLDALIDRQLELGETNRYQPPEPAGIPNPGPDGGRPVAFQHSRGIRAGARTSPAFRRTS